MKYLLVLSASPGYGCMAPFPCRCSLCTWSIQHSWLWLYEWHPFYAGDHHAHWVSIRAIRQSWFGCMTPLLCRCSPCTWSIHQCYPAVQVVDLWQNAGAHHAHGVSIGAIQQSWLWMYDTLSMLVITMCMKQIFHPGNFWKFCFLQYHICLTLPANQWTKELIKPEWSWRIGSSMTMPVPVVSEGAYFSNRPFFILFFQTSVAWCKLNSFFPIKCMCWSKHVLVQRRMQQKEFEQHLEV